jgi:hypothetical protein
MEGVAPSMTAESTYVIDAPTAIDHEGDVGRYSAVAIAGGTLLVAYRDDTNRALKVARSTDGGATWTTRFVDWVGDPGANASLAASGDIVAVAYQDAAAADLRCAVSTDAGASWRRSLVDAAGTAGAATAVAVGSTGVIHLAYHESVAGDVKYASSADGGATWTPPRTLDASASDCGRHVSIAVNGSSVYVAYYDATAGDLRLGVLSGSGSWTSSALDTTGNVGQCPSLRWDPASTTAWLAYHDVTNSRLKIARSIGGVSSWSTAGLANGGVVDDAGITGLHASLAVSGTSGQYLAVAYYRDWDYRLVVARSADGGGSWTTEDVGGEGLGQWASIAVTGEEPATHAPTYVVSCYDSLPRDLRLAAWNGTAWTVR